MKIIRVTRCVIAWSLKNIRKNINDTITVDSNEITLPDGYYTFSDLETELKKHNVTIKKLLNNSIKVSCTKDANLKSLGSSLLGFEENFSLTNDTDYVSTKPASLTNGLKDIHVYCSLVDFTQNICYIPNTEDTTNYNASTFLLFIPIDTTQSLNGNYTIYNTQDIKVPCRHDFRFQEIEFIVESAGTANDYEIFMSLELY